MGTESPFSLDGREEARYTRCTFFVMRIATQIPFNVSAARSLAPSMTWLGHAKARAKAGVGAVTKG